MSDSAGRTLTPGGYGRYEDDPAHVGCPRAKTDMTPCAARDGEPATYDTTGECVGCDKHAADLLRDLVAEVTAPASTLVSAGESESNDDPV